MPADARFPVADVGVHADASQQLFVRHGLIMRPGRPLWPFGGEERDVRRLLSGREESMQFVFGQRLDEPEALSR
jgi:hypothetical protein